MRFTCVLAMGAILSGHILSTSIPANAQESGAAAQAQAEKTGKEAARKKDGLDKLSPEQRKYIEFARNFMKTYKPQTGKVLLTASPLSKTPIAELKVPKGFYYLNPKDSETVLTKIWGNPPGNHVLGMIFPKKYSLFGNDIWGVAITYKEDGYVSDADAEKIDYDALLAQMKKDVRESSRARESMGYGSIELVGWAAKPYYDKTTHKMYWAKELAFGKGKGHTLNYNIRVLGRKGVLVLNFVGSMKQKQQIEQNLKPVLAMANFQSGNRYEDFTPGLDKVAAYGIGALVAGKVIAKTGLLAAIGLFFLKFAKLFVVAGVALVAGIGKLFGRRGEG